MSIQNFIPEVWTASIMQALYESHIFAQPAVVNRNYEGEIKTQGDTIHITGIEPVSIGDYKRYQDIVFEEIDLNTRTMSIDQAKYFALAIDDIDKWQQKEDTMGPAMNEAGYKMSLAVDLYLRDVMMRFVELSPSNIEMAAVGGGDAGTRGQAVRSAFVKLRTQLKRNNVQAQGQWAIVSPEVYAVLLEDPHFIEADKRGNASVVESNGVVGSMYGFNIMESNNAPTTGTTHHVLAGNNTAVSYAEALTEVKSVEFEKTFGDGIKGLHVYGAKGIRPEGLVRVDLTGLSIPKEPVTFRDATMVEDGRGPSRFARDMTPSHTTPFQKPGLGEVDVAPVDDTSDAVPARPKKSTPTPTP